ncbi:DUF2381 family protein [Pyxidicoccus xibeiensis]|uniref:DUF2381 family protein n=1 Tax=Pyxidicoccus xibeiensis TaxID=2906759 RepID=UPI0020A6EDF6|nr:DUF2381 family protein [Pyxidicoccus xibeiensis]MCP3141730.1 DUF2381 family protein [Pyxidicoccus xibeiensis]
MTTFQGTWARVATTLGLLMLAMPSGAQSPEWQSFADLPRPRNLFVSKDPKSAVPQISVAGGVATTLRFEKPCDPSRTRLLGWEGRFEPLLVGGRSVLIVPLRTLAAGERFLLHVTLMDGTSIPFTVTSNRYLTDGQVNVYPDAESPEAVRKALAEKQKENEELLAENQRQREEETSANHALAALLATGQLKLTPFKKQEVWRLYEDGVELEVAVMLTREAVPRRKAAVVFKVTNKAPAGPWELQEARLMNAETFKQLPVALRMAPAAIVPGATGHVALVTDLASFGPTTADTKLILELFRSGGLRQAYVELKPHDWRR